MKNPNAGLFVFQLHDAALNIKPTTKMKFTLAILKTNHVSTNATEQTSIIDGTTVKWLAKEYIPGGSPRICGIENMELASIFEIDGNAPEKDGKINHITVKG